MTQGPALFQMGVPAIETFPATLFARIRAHAVRAEASTPPLYPDPRGELELRREIAGYLAVARGINCSPSQVIITGGFGAGSAWRSVFLAWAEHRLGRESRLSMVQEGLELARWSSLRSPLMPDGIDIDHGLRHHPDAKLVVVTPGQQAPLGPTLSLERRLRLLEWAAANQVWVIEDDYPSDCNWQGRAAPALASLDRADASSTSARSARRSVRLFGSASVAPVELILGSRSGGVPRAATRPRGATPTAEFMREGDYMRHSGRTSRARRRAVGAAGSSSSVASARSCCWTRLGCAAESPKGNIGRGRRTRSLGVRHVSGAAFKLVCVG